MRPVTQMIIGRWVHAVPAVLVGNWMVAWVVRMVNPLAKVILTSHRTGGQRLPGRRSCSLTAQVRG